MTLSRACRACGALADDGGLCLDCEAGRDEAAEIAAAIRRGEIDEADAAPWRDEPALDRSAT